MARSLRVGTLAISLPIGQTLLIAAAILIVVVGGSEAAVRNRSIRSGLVTPIVTGQNQIAAKLDLLEGMRREGPIDCFFVGSSMVLRDINPEVVAKAYADQGGGPLRCFNFGLSGLSIEGTARLSNILVAQYHPRLIVYGTSFRDFAEEFGFNMDIPWAHYQLGRPSIDGWLETVSMSYRYMLAYTHQEELALSGQYDQGYTPYGYLEADGVLDVSVPPSRAANRKQYDAMKDYAISAQMRDNLRQLLALRATGTALVVVEMPVPMSTLNFLGNPEQDYQHFADVVADETGAQSVPFWLTLKSDMIPADSWSDYTHMNRSGATLFSLWLGDQLAGVALPAAAH